MTDETSTLEQGGGEVLPQQPTKPAYVDDVTDAQADNPAPDKPATAEPVKDEAKKRNRTAEYISKINAERADLARKIAELESRIPKAPEPKEPTLEQFDYDVAAHARAAAQWEVQQARKQWDQEQNTKAEDQKQQEAVSAYTLRAADFADAHDDFIEVVGSIPQELLPSELQAAIMAHEKGPEIAYQLALNEDELFNLAAMRPELMARAVERYASRMSDAPKGEPAAPEAPALAQAQIKPITQAPAPAPRVGGRAPADVPQDKLTDDEWYRKERNKG